MDELSDEDLMRRYADGDAAAFEVLYRRHKGPLFRFVLRQLPDRSTAEEAFQDVWTNLIRSRERYEVKAKFTTWLYRMAHNKVIDLHRSHRRRAETNLMTADTHDDGCPAIGEPVDTQSASPEHTLGIRRAVTQLYTALQQLPDNQREAFLLQEEGGMSLNQIAQVTGVGRETVKSRLRYATAKLRSAVSWAGDEQ